MLKGLKGLPGLGGVARGKQASPGAALLQNYITRLTAQGGTLTGLRLSTLSTLLDTLVTSGVASRFHYAILPGAPDSFAGFNVPLIDSLVLGNCTSNYISTEWNGTGLKGTSRFLQAPYIPGLHTTVDNSHLSIYFSENRVVSLSTVMGCQDGGGALQMYADGYIVANQYSDGSDRVVQYSPPLAGLTLASRSSSTLHELRTPSGAGVDKLAHSSTAARAGAPPNTNFRMMSTSAATRTLFSSVGLSISGPQYTALSNALAAYTLARGV